MFQKVKKIHFVGIGGIGMSGIAELLMNLGYIVTGSDLIRSPIIDRLQERGATISIGHDVSNLGDAEVLVYSSAVNENNPELSKAREMSIPVLRRAEMLGELIAVKETSIAIGGTHGKTSTTSMVGSILSSANMDPTLVVGGLVKSINTNTMLGSGNIIVVEADEFDRSFLALRPTIAMVNNIELEHTDCYDSIEELQSAFLQFCNATPFYGEILLGIDSAGVQSILPQIQRPVLTYGIKEPADITAHDLFYEENITKFTVSRNGKRIGDIELSMPGEHNVQNALGAVSLGLELDIPFTTIKSGLKDFQGVRRRFEIKGEIDGVIIVDDYAHHPTEVQATIKAAKRGWNRRLITVFQPHLYTRTRDFYQDFANAFTESDILIVTEIYPAREEKIPGITGELVTKAAQDLGHTDAQFVADLKDLHKILRTLSQPGDMIITIGAGNIWRFCEDYYQQLSNKTVLT
ncbi:MAG: UDP-N-acetylmuramate--L-alanine ligase [Candidatus Neomarinimicrobiota bacterium]